MWIRAAARFRVAGAASEALHPAHAIGIARRRLAWLYRAGWSGGPRTGRGRTRFSGAVWWSGCRSATRRSCGISTNSTGGIANGPESSGARRSLCLPVRPIAEAGLTAGRDCATTWRPLRISSDATAVGAFAAPKAKLTARMQSNLKHLRRLSHAGSMFSHRSAWVARCQRDPPVAGLIEGWSSDSDRS